jgi:chromosome segregation protein
VLGEQSAKALRGGEMADVIFNGTDGRKPMGMGEVSLTLGGVGEESLARGGRRGRLRRSDAHAPDFSRRRQRIFSEQTPCRLKDIQQLFMGTGVGRTSYSILAQGHITQILSSKPEDRRMIFEEAAGITKFKSQKKESLRKLEYTEQNLLRVADTIKEVKRQIGSLQRQAGKAKRYKQISQELQHLETQLARHQFDVLQGKFPNARIPPSKICGTKSSRARTTFCVLKMRSQAARTAFRTGTRSRRATAARAGIEGRN